MRGFLIAIVLSFSFAIHAKAQTLDNSQGAIEIDDSPSPSPSKSRGNSGPAKVGRKAAEKYMPVRAPKPRPVIDEGTHYLAVHVGIMASDNAYYWGKDAATNVGKTTLGVSYRVGEWINSMDLLVRIDYTTYSLDEGHASKLSFLPMVTFPDATSRFPLYFGAAIGPGVFFNQINKESALSLDYQLIAGARFFNVVQTTGFFVEAGLKNHIFLLSDGQYNGTFLAAGAVFTF